MDSEDFNKAFPYNISTAIYSLSLFLSFFLNWYHISLKKPFFLLSHYSMSRNVLLRSQQETRTKQIQGPSIDQLSCEQQQNSQMWGGLTKQLLWHIMIFPLWIRTSPAWCHHVKHKILAINAWAPRYSSITMIGQNWDVIGQPQTHTSTILTWWRKFDLAYDYIRCPENSKTWSMDVDDVPTNSTMCKKTLQIRTHEIPPF